MTWSSRLTSCSELVDVISHRAQFVLIFRFHSELTHLFELSVIPREWSCQYRKREAKGEQILRTHPFLLQHLSVHLSQVFEITTRSLTFQLYPPNWLLLQRWLLVAKANTQDSISTRYEISEISRKSNEPVLERYRVAPSQWSLWRLLEGVAWR